MRLISSICHRWHLPIMSDIRCQRWQMTDISRMCLQKHLCKCSNLVEKWNWLDLYKMKMAGRSSNWVYYLSKLFFGGYLGIDPALGRWTERLLKFSEMRDTIRNTHMWGMGGSKHSGQFLEVMGGVHNVERLHKYFYYHPNALRGFNQTGFKNSETLCVCWFVYLWCKKLVSRLLPEITKPMPRQIYYRVVVGHRRN